MILEPGEWLQVAYTGEGTELRVVRGEKDGSQRIVKEIAVFTKEQHVEIWRQLGTSYHTADTELGAAWLDLHAAKDKLLEAAKKLVDEAEALPASRFMKKNYVVGRMK